MSASVVSFTPISAAVLLGLLLIYCCLC